MQPMAQLVDEPRTGILQYFGATVSHWRRRLGVAVKEARSRALLRAELSRLDEAGELRLVLGDLGLSRSAVPALEKNHPGSSRRLAAMLHRLGIRVLPAGEASAEMRAIERTCLVCGASGRCERELRSSKATRLARSFCPNAPAFDELVVSGKATRNRRA